MPHIFSKGWRKLHLIKHILAFVSYLLVIMLTFRHGKIQFSKIIIGYMELFKLSWENKTYVGSFIRAKGITHRIRKEPLPYSQHRT